MTCADGRGAGCYARRRGTGRAAGPARRRPRRGARGPERNLAHGRRARRGGRGLDDDDDSIGPATTTTAPATTTTAPQPPDDHDHRGGHDHHDTAATEPARGRRLDPRGLPLALRGRDHRADDRRFGDRRRNASRARRRGRDRPDARPGGDVPVVSPTERHGVPRRGAARHGLDSGRAPGAGDCDRTGCGGASRHHQPRGVRRRTPRSGGADRVAAPPRLRGRRHGHLAGERPSDLGARPHDHRATGGWGGRAAHRGERATPGRVLRLEQRLVVPTGSALARRRRADPRRRAPRSRPSGWRSSCSPGSGSIRRRR